jgi:hypothetical protein
MLVLAILGVLVWLLTPLVERVSALAPLSRRRTV